ncbi:MAG TPA: PrsW family glutamic-type intramembrane protease [Puia sp.]|nr:PrsW family glutamic-type intramembrane protease [Puia sp.]
MFLLALAIAPGIAIFIFIWSLNRMGKTSARFMITSFLLGALATVPPLVIQLLSVDVRVEPWRHSILSYIWYAFGVVAFSEEGSKFLVLRFYAYPKTVFRQPFDGVVFCVAIGMGFATVENIEYVRQFGLETGVSRFFLAIPAHAAFAVLMGYPVGRAKFVGTHVPVKTAHGEEPSVAAVAKDSRNLGRFVRHRSFRLMAKGLAVAVLFHGSFDFFVFLQQNREARKYLSTSVLSFGAFATFYIAVRLAMRALRTYRTVPEQDIEND